MALVATLLVLVLTPFALLIRKDRADYRAFKALTETADRQRRFRIWTIKSFFIFGCTSLIALSILGRLSALVTLPRQFHLLSAFFRAHGPTPSTTAGFFLGLAFALIAILFAGVLKARGRGKKRPVKIITVGDIAPLLPRNWAEIAHAAIMSLNAGFSEELYFRLLLPLLLATLIGHAIPAFVLATILFGLAHIYQGLIGVIATTVVGLVMVVIYMLTATIWAPIAAHAFMDLLGLVIRPSLMRIFAPDAQALPTQQAP
jgi:membrane protease YdiL (CAAX protease family)